MQIFSASYSTHAHCAHVSDLVQTRYQKSSQMAVFDSFEAAQDNFGIVQK